MSRRMQDLSKAAVAPSKARDVAPRPPASRSDDNVRMTLLLKGDEADALKQLCLKLGSLTGRRGIAHSEVVRVLLRLAENENGETWKNLRDEIETHGGNRRGGRT